MLSASSLYSISCTVLAFSIILVHHLDHRASKDFSPKEHSPLRLSSLQPWRQLGSSLSSAAPLVSPRSFLPFPPVPFPFNQQKHAKLFQTPVQSPPGSNKIWTAEPSVLWKSGPAAKSTGPGECFSWSFDRSSKDTPVVTCRWGPNKQFNTNKKMWEIEWT